MGNILNDDYEDVLQQMESIEYVCKLPFLLYKNIIIQPEDSWNHSTFALSRIPREDKLGTRKRRGKNK